MGQEPPTGPGLSASSSDCTLRISFKGKIRLAGGQPLFEARTPTITGLAGSPGLFSFRTSSRPIDVIMKLSDQAALVSFSLSPNGNQSDSGAQFLGFFFSDIPEFDKGVTLWRYKPWNSWTTPIAVRAVGEMQEWDVQFFYWRYSDGVYGAAMPLSGNGYRTTLGQFRGHFGSKSVSFMDGTRRESEDSKEIPGDSRADRVVHMEWLGHGQESERGFFVEGCALLC